MSETIIHLMPEYFGKSENLLLEYGSLSASSFIFASGVRAIRLKSERGEVVMLPFQGQQIWSAMFDGRNLTMKSMFSEPKVTQNYLETYGGFLIHCGMTAMGVPAEGDTHPLHGELPNAPFQKASIISGQDKRGRYIALAGSYQHTQAFSTNYLAKPLVKLYEGSSLLDVSLEVSNLKQTPMELMYLAHANFRPVNDATLIYSAKVSAETVRVRRSIPSHVKVKAGYREFIEALGNQPEKHHILKPDLAFDPEVVFSIDYLADKAGWAHSLQLHPDGKADYIAHKPKQLKVGVRWICRTPDQDALGLVLPATAEPEGYSAEKKKGNIEVLKAGRSWRCEMIMGSLTKQEASAISKTIRQLKTQSGG
jgi:hypothetical protein